MNNDRRHFLQSSFTYGVLSILTLKTLLSPEAAFAIWRSGNFTEQSFAATWQQLFQEQSIETDRNLQLTIPQSAENGANVPLTIQSDLDNIRKIYLLVEKNPVPLSAEFELTPEVAVFIKARIKMAESCDVIVVAVTEDEQLLQTRQFVTVRQGGCGG